MSDDPIVKALVALHAGLAQQGPGSPASTCRALAACAHLPPEPEVLDIGCGAGNATMTLLEATEGPVTATDLFPSFLAQLEERAAAFGDRLQTVEADMAALPFGPRFDLLWSEGAAYIMGFDAALASWRALLRPGGYLALTEISWLQTPPPEEAVTYWNEAYPGIRSVQANVDAALAAGFEVVEHFALPASDWWAYYAPLEARLAPFAQAHAGEEAAQAVVAMTEAEIDLYRRLGESYGYVFYILRWPGSPS